jgi:hypothetical protein
VPVDEEIARVAPVVRRCGTRGAVPLSVNA